MAVNKPHGMTRDDLRALFAPVGTTAESRGHVFTAEEIIHSYYDDSYMIQVWSSPTCSERFQARVIGSQTKPALRYHCHSHGQTLEKTMITTVGRHDAAMRQARALIRNYGVKS